METPQPHEVVAAASLEGLLSAATGGLALAGLVSMIGVLLRGARNQIIKNEAGEQARA